MRGLKLAFQSKTKKAIKEAIETENIVFKEDDERNSEASKIYEVSDNGTFHFRITASTGRSYMAEITVKNAAPLKKDLLTGIADINEAGYKMIKVKGKTKEVDPTIEEVEKMEKYTLDVIYCDGDLILKNGSFTLNENKQQVAKTIDGLSLSGKREDKLFEGTEEGAACTEPESLWHCISRGGRL